MKLYHEFENKSRLIAKSVLKGINKEEQAELDHWISEGKSNRELFDRIKDYNNHLTRIENLSEIDTHKGWNTVHAEITKYNRSRIIKKVTRIAAVFMIPVVISALFFLVKPKTEPNNRSARVTDIGPGSSKAMLILNDGSKIALDDENKLEIEEAGLAIIENDEDGLKYSESIKESGAPPVSQEITYNEIAIPKGGEYKFRLADGTTIYLNSMTTIKYPVLFSGNTREVEISGEAFFEVAHNPSKPFIVKSKHLNIEVLGTSFNISSYEEDKFVETTLVEGKIKVHGLKNLPEKEWYLKPGLQAKFNKQSSELDIKKVNLSVYTSWKNGVFVFHDEKLEDIMTILSRWYNIEIQYDNPGLKQIQFSGRINRYENIDPILDIMTSTGSLKIESDAQKLIFK